MMRHTLLFAAALDVALGIVDLRYGFVALGVAMLVMGGLCLFARSQLAAK